MSNNTYINTCRLKFQKYCCAIALHISARNVSHHSDGNKLNFYHSLDDVWNSPSLSIQFKCLCDDDACLHCYATWHTGLTIAECNDTFEMGTCAAKVIKNMMGHCCKNCLVQNSTQNFYIVKTLRKCFYQFWYMGRSRCHCYSSILQNVSKKY